MVAKSPEQQELEKIRLENQRLLNENKRLNNHIAEGRHAGARFSGRFFRTLGVSLLVLVAVAFLFVGNMFFWAGNTVVKTDRYVETVQPLIGNPTIQTAIATYTSQQLFATVDVEKFTEEALPPRAAFLAPSIASQVKQQTENAINKILARPAFQDRWNSVNENAHAKLIATIKNNGADGVINLNEFYQQISQQFKGTRLSFLADKPLPAKVGSIEIVQGEWLATANKVITHIDTWRTLAVLLLLAASAGAVWLSRNKRKTVVLLGLLASVSMFITLILVRVTRELIAGKVGSDYTEAARQAAQTVFHPLIVQTVTILAFGLIVAFVAWVSGPSKNAAKLTEKIRFLLGGKLHSALFTKENPFTLFLGKHKRVFQWGVVAIGLLSLLFIRLTPLVLLLLALSALLLVLLVEAFSAEPPRQQAER